MDPRQRLHALASNRSGSGYRMAVQPGSTTARVDLYDEIGYFGVSARDFARDLQALEDVDTIELHVSSPGGDVFDGIAITNALRQHPARVVATVDGLAASAASFIVAGSADEVVMARNSELMIHDAWGMAIGNAADMRKLADDLDRISNNIASMYADKAGGTVADWRDVMLAETWFSAEEAVEAGLADRVETKREDDEDAPAKAAFDLSVFAHAGRAHAPAPRTPVASASGSRNTQTSERSTAVAFSDEQMTALREFAGVPSDADEGTILAALEDKVTAPAPQPTPTTPTVPEGMALVDQATLNALRTDAAAGREARNRQLEQERAAIVDSAVQDGRIPPARREHWLNQLAADPGAEQVLASLAPGLVPLEELGDSGTQVRNQASTEDDTYRQLFGDTPKEG
ncbi:head maturation protease, ClpP-related [Kineococcus terrestris]|uniref:head maturation protease, ClpP-related n=1 Tax=Kineococcus terrestris TaxID=2044856 RepID=UPI0034DB6E5E